ncbi:hypothetical protein [Roseinatronobacter alkalisoli]|uniref:DUF2746 domain-containing protein n=1 Tax=Roseinatronobacter alkalisoli TaxID=3028235 RepID=A0ABT5TEA8_9RHOB|nr:hypothetical protein [Roseinatronobacter sp. HJB301]MDD7973453.1 hypothetical protein [Roseinatronobacter sp. HJB301]
MDVWRLIQEAWPLFTVLVGGLIFILVRVEVEMALTRANIKALWARRKEERAEFAEMVAILRSDHNAMRTEIHTEMRGLRDLLVERSVERRIRQAERMD